MAFISNVYQKYMRTRNRDLILYDIFFNTIFAIIIIPIINQGLNLVMKSWGESYITGRNLFSFLSHPPVILFLILVIFSFFVFILWKMTTKIQHCINRHKDYNSSRRFIISFFEGLSKTSELVSLGNVMLPFYAFVQFVFMLIPVLVAVAFQLNIPPHLIRASSDQLAIRVLIITLLIFIAFLAIRGLFVIPICVNEHEDFHNSLTRSKELMKGNYLKTLLRLLTYNLILLALLYLLYYTIIFSISMIIYLTVENTWVVTVFLRIYSRTRVYLLLIFTTIAYTTNLNLITTIYLESYQDKEELSKENLVNKEKHQRINLFSEKYRGAKIFILLLLISIGITNFLVTIKNDTIYLKEALPGIQIVSHRGYSNKAPENTIPAIEQAILAHADYVEIDVQQTKDGVLVLLHDRSLKRTTGLNKLLGDVNYSDIKYLDAGLWFSKEFYGTTIPTLEEVFEICKGRIKLSIDLKIHGKEIDLEKNLVELIEKYDFEDNCFVSSFQYDIISNIKELNENIRTGYIMSPAYGSFYDKPHMDFLSVRASLVNRNIVESAHKAGKEVHVWTVNKRIDLERMKSLGVDFVITDNPKLAIEVLLSDDTTNTFIEMLNRMSSY